VIWNHGRLLSGLKMADLPFDDETAVPPGVLLGWCGDRNDDSFDDTRDERLISGCCRSDFHAGAHAQI